MDALGLRYYHQYIAMWAAYCAGRYYQMRRWLMEYEYRVRMAN